MLCQLAGNRKGIVAWAEIHQLDVALAVLAALQVEDERRENSRLSLLGMAVQQQESRQADSQQSILMTDPEIGTLGSILLFPNVND